MVRKILIEGMDYAGKSTISRSIVSHYINHGLGTIYNKGNLIKTNVDEFVNKELYRQKSDLIRLNALLT